jgi:F-type H+-transporting ATPase subunit a
VFENPDITGVTRTVSGAADTVKILAQHGASNQAEHFDFMHLLDHAKDSHAIEIPWISFSDSHVQLAHQELPRIPLIHIGGLAVDLSPTKHVVFLLFCALVLILIAVYTARKYRKTIVPHGLVNLAELLIVFVRDEIAIPNMGPRGTRYVPYLLTTFFYILLMNLAGLVPFGSTATSNIMVTAGLAFVAFIMIQASAIRSQGLKHYLLHLTGDVHWSLWIIMIPIEIIGLFTKPFALCIRLFANMSAGHIVILSLLGLIFMFHSIAVAPASVAFALFINMLELFVAVLQAYIFTMLTSVFMGIGMQARHDSHDLNY